MPLTQPWMSALLNVAIRAAESSDPEIAQTFFGAGQIMRGIHRAKNVVAGDLRVERVDKTGESFFANLLVEFPLVNLHSE